MSRYEPYKMDNFQKLMQACYTLGWYGGCPTLMKVEMMGQFEGWYGRASETWEHRFRVTTQEVKDGDRILFPGVSAEDETLDGACKKVLDKLTTPETK